MAHAEIPAGERVSASGRPRLPMRWRHFNPARFCVCRPVNGACVPMEGHPPLTGWAHKFRPSGYDLGSLGLASSNGTLDANVPEGTKLPLPKFDFGKPRRGVMIE